MTDEMEAETRAGLSEVIHLPDLSHQPPKPKLLHPSKRRRVKDPKDCVITFRCTPVEHRLFAEHAGEAGLKIGPYLRQQETGTAGPRARRMVGPDMVMLAKVLAALGKSGSNLNQIARQLNMDEPADLEELRAALIEHRAAVALLMASLVV